MVKRIVVALVFLPVLFLVFCVLPPVYLTIMVAGISAIASYELLRAVGASDRKDMCVLTAVAAALVAVCYWQGAQEWGVRLILMVLMCSLFLIGILTYGKDNPVKVESILYGLVGGVLIPSCLSALIQLKMLENGHLLVLLPVVVAFLTDIGAYFVGIFFGKHRGITLVSPKKSVEGFVGGLISGMVFMLLYGLVLSNVFHLEVRMVNLAAYGVAGSLVTELGDLSLSLIKRQYGIKDYGDLLPGHGGMLDRFDSMIFAAPTMWVLVNLFPAL